MTKIWKAPTWKTVEAALKAKGNTFVFVDRLDCNGQKALFDNNFMLLTRNPKVAMNFVAIQ
jgi:hypothetical protein